jgi:tRNA A37 threonylcarbamoyladenosine dehydratase
MQFFERTIGLIGEDKFLKLQKAHVLVCGIGGVGGTAVEALVRSGIGNITIVDFDSVSDTNINRQILFTSEDIGKNKVDVALERLKKINPECHIKIVNKKIDEEFTLEDKYDYIIDAIDDVKGKKTLAKLASINKIPIIISLGMANKLDPSKVRITRLDKTTDDPLARKIRYEYKKEGIDTKSIITVNSIETPITDGNKLNSMMIVPSTAGLQLASYVIQELIK